MISSTDEHGSVANEPASDEASRAVGAEGAGAASLDKVRDILFGGHMRDVERRFARLEERLLKETSDLKDDVRRRLDALELYTKNETESLAGQIKSEHEDRVESSSRQLRDAAETTRSIERRITTLDEQLAKGQRELRSQLLEQHQRLSDDIRHKMEDVGRRWPARTGGLPDGQGGPHGHRVAADRKWRCGSPASSDSGRQDGGSGRMIDRRAQQGRGFAELRSIIVGPEQRELRALQDPRSRSGHPDARHRGSCGCHLAAGQRSAIDARARAVHRGH
jgi:hypothetical protein